MASKRALRRSACAGKRRYETAEDARKHSLRNLQVYRCRFCGGYHAGHGPKRKVHPGRRP